MAFLVFSISGFLFFEGLVLSGGLPLCLSISSVDFGFYIHLPFISLRSLLFVSLSICVFFLSFPLCLGAGTVHDCGFFWGDDFVCIRGGWVLVTCIFVSWVVDRLEGWLSEVVTNLLLDIFPVII